jgi:hypothetical protein
MNDLEIEVYEAFNQPDWSLDFYEQKEKEKRESKNGH